VTGSGSSRAPRPSSRSYERIGKADLRRLGQLAAEDRDYFYRRRPEYRGRLFCVALCQGAAQHYLDVERGAAKPNGVKDFDVYSFFANIGGKRFPADRRQRHTDFGPSGFGREQAPDPRWRHYTGRRVDFLFRGLAVSLGDDPVEALRRYLGAGRTKTARLLALKGAVLIEPEQLLGRIAWPHTGPVGLTLDGEPGVRGRQRRSHPGRW